MELQVTTLDGKADGSVTLKDEIFGLEVAPGHPAPHGPLPAAQGDVRHRTTSRTAPRSLAPARSSSSRRARAALVTAIARLRSSVVVVVPSVPTPRSHAIDLPKKVRALALKHALSAKAKAGEIVIVRHVRAPDGQDRGARARSSASSTGPNALIIDGAEVDKNFALAARNIPQIDVLPVQGINVVDILRRHKLVLTKAALEALEARFA